MLVLGGRSNVVPCSRLPGAWLLPGVLLACACGGESTNGGAPAGAAEPGGMPAEPGNTGAEADRFAVCPTPLGTPEELARTPRADSNLELLALTLDVGQVTATQATYDRLVADLGAMRARTPSLESVAFWPPHDGHSLAITFGEEATNAFHAGTYKAWDCLLDAYRAEIGPVVDIFPTYAPTLYLDGIFDMPRLAEVFGQLPDASVEINATPGRRTLCVQRNGEHYEYVVDRTNGGCDSPPACRGNARHFASDAPGEVTTLEAWTGTDGATLPSWFTDVCN